MTFGEQPYGSVAYAEDPAPTGPPAPKTAHLAGRLPKVRAVLTATASAEAHLAGHLPALRGALTAVGGNQATLTGRLPDLTGLLTTGRPVQADTSNRAGGRVRSGYGVATWAPPVPDDVLDPGLPVGGTTAPHSRVAVTVYDSIAFVPGTTQPTIAKREASRKRATDRILVGGVDITTFRGIRTPVPSYMLIEPLLYGSGTLTLPQVMPVWEQLGAGDLYWLTEGAPVVVQTVSTTDADDAFGTIVETVYKGIITDFDVSGRTLTCQVDGEAAGRAALQDRQPPVFIRTNDLGFWWWDLITQLGLPFEPRLGPDTGITLRNAGATSQLDYANELSSKGARRDGTQLTCMPKRPENGGAYHVLQKDTTTINATVYLDDARAVPDLHDNLAEKPNRVYATGTNPHGMRVDFAAYPVLRNDDPPPYPMRDGGQFGRGTTDADTDTGDGVSVMVWRLVKAGYLELADKPGGYDADAAAAIHDLQDDSDTASVALFSGEGPSFYDAAYAHNHRFAVDPEHPARPYQTVLTDAQTEQFEDWVNGWEIPFDLDAAIVDYDMRGFWKAERPTSWHAGDHFPDTWKTPYDTTFSAESQYATDDNPFVWHGDDLIDQRDGSLIFGPGTTGIMNPRTWAALFDASVTGYSIAGATILPAADRAAVRKWTRSSNGSVIARNPKYDPSVIKVDTTVDMGVDMKIQHMRDWAHGELAPNGRAWTGTITLHTGAVIDGVHNPGDPLDASRVLDARLLRTGQNIWCPHFDGGTLLHISGIQRQPADQTSPETFVLTVDSRARDTMKVWEVIKRNRDTRRSPARSWLAQHRSSRFHKDAVQQWSAWAGVIDDRVNLAGGAWTVFPVIGGQEGQVERLLLQTSPNTEFVTAVFGRKISPARLGQLVGNPLSTKGRKRWAKKSVRDQLDDDAVLLYAAGTDTDPCGYYPRTKTIQDTTVGHDNDDPNDDDSVTDTVIDPATGLPVIVGDTGQPQTVKHNPLTGVWRDDAGFPYRCFGGPLLWVAIWARDSTHLAPGRIMWPQLESGS